MSRRVLGSITWVAAVLAALAGGRFALAAWFRHTGAAWAVAPAGEVDTGGVFDVAPARVALVQVMGFDTRADAVLSRAAVWMPFLLVAVVLAALAWQLGRRPGRSGWADLLEPRVSQVVLAVSVAAVGVVPGLAQTLASHAVLDAAGSPAGYAPLPVDVDPGWWVAGALLLVGRAALVRERARRTAAEPALAPQPA